MTTTSSDLNRLRVVDLRAIAKSRGLRGYSQLRKDELIPILESPEKYSLKNVGKLRAMPPWLCKEEEIDAFKQERIDNIKKEIISDISFIEHYRILTLKEIAKSIGLRGYSKLRKAELIDLLKQNLPFESSGGK